MPAPFVTPRLSLGDWSGDFTNQDNLLKIDALGGAAGEIIMQSGSSNPPIPLENEDQNDYLYAG
jgi:hypothetical protein